MVGLTLSRQMNIYSTLIRTSLLSGILDRVISVAYCKKILPHHKNSSRYRPSQWAWHASGRCKDLNGTVRTLYVHRHFTKLHWHQCWRHGHRSSRRHSIYNKGKEHTKARNIHVWIYWWRHMDVYVSRFTSHSTVSSHYSGVTMSATASQITSLTIVYSKAHSGTDQRKYQSYASLAFVRGIQRWPVNSPHKGSVTRKIFLFDDVIMDNLFWLSSKEYQSPAALGLHKDPSTISTM